jgi:hypothetical protein
MAIESSFKNMVITLFTVCLIASAALGGIYAVTEEPIAVFIVHEAPDNPCSERAAIQEYFRSHGIECEEL